MLIKNLQNLTNVDLNKTVWRYLTFPKFISLITYKALWFPKLNILQDEFEGGLPLNTEAKMREKNEKVKGWLKNAPFRTPISEEEINRQIDNWPDNNVRDGRELCVVNCWFLNDIESEKMWMDYVGCNEGVALKSTIGKLAHHVYCFPEDSHIGKVEYINFESHLMSQYEASQAVKRAFLKDEKYKHEKEIRIVCLSLRTPNCVGMNGVRLSPDDCQGAKMNNFEDPGLYILTDIGRLLTSIVLAPNTPEWFELLVRRIIDFSGFKFSIERSALEGK